MIKTNLSGTHIQVTIVINKDCYEAINKERAAKNCTFSEVARDIIDHIRVPGGDDGDDGSYKPLCDDFRKLGFVVVDGDSKGNYKK